MSVITRLEFNGRTNGFCPSIYWAPCDPTFFCSLASKDVFILPILRQYVQYREDSKSRIPHLSGEYKV